MEFDKEKWKVNDWKSLNKLYWILNPLLFGFDFLLGQRMPKVSLINKNTKLPKYERRVIPCPHCNYLHDARTWSAPNNTVFYNWFGLYCNNCENIIPCLPNGLSYLLQIITYPIWGLFKKSLKEKWLKKQPKRFENLNFSGKIEIYSGQGWIKQGLFWAAYMYLFMTFLFPLVFNESYSMTKILIGIPLWIIFGLIYGYSLKYFIERKRRKRAENLK